MAVDYRFRRSWFRKQGRLPPETVTELRTLLNTFGRRDGEDETDYLLRLERQNADFIAQLDREEADEFRE